MRATWALLHGDVPAAVGYNLLFVPALVWVSWGWLAGWTRIKAPATSRRGIYVAAAAVALFTVARNLPGSPLAP